MKNRPLYAFVALDNIGSIRVLEKCGFILCEDGSRVDGDGVEEVLMALGHPDPGGAPSALTRRPKEENHE